jgi:site-specific recombinase XerD
MKTLAERTEQDLELSGYSPITKRTYLGCVKKIEQYYGRPAETLRGSEIKDFLSYIIREKQASSSRVNQVYSALKFLYEKTLYRTWVMKKIPRFKMERKLPSVLDRREIERLFAVMDNVKH